MSLQWTLVATFLYAEVAFMIIFLLPFISPTRWQRIFKSRLVTAITSYASIYFNVILVALVLLLLDAIREISKYKTMLHESNDPEHGSLHYGPTMELVKEFRAQRNFYISGISLFLWFVMKRLLALIANSAQLIAENHAIKAMAESANRAALANLKKDEKSDDSKTSSSTSGNLTKLNEILKLKEEECETLQRNYAKAKIDLETMKKQSESVTREYDNLLKDHAKITAKLERYESEGSLFVSGSSSENKKQN